MIVAPADDVDHRKTSLVMALTGIDTDRLAEEKRRGLLIDLGFAPADLGGDALIGFIDLPGHEGFIRNLVAGVASIDLALLVVAGAVVSGQACVGDALIVSPQGTAVRLRGIQTHGRAMAEARRGQRCALNLVGAGLKRESVKRGDWVVALAAHARQTATTSGWALLMPSRRRCGTPTSCSATLPPQRCRPGSPRSKAWRSNRVAKALRSWCWSGENRTLGGG